MTAVEWLVKQYENNFPLTFDAIDKAKEMEKEQMEITWNNAIDAQLKDKWDSYDDFHRTNL
jgi:hypothetical protein